VIGTGGEQEKQAMGREIVITGCNGWIGGHVAAALQTRGWSVTGVSRAPEEASRRHPGTAWIGTGPELEEAVARAGVVLNLAGRHAFEQPWTPEYVEQMRTSRVETTRRVVAALATSAAADRVLVSGSGYPVYGDRGEELLPETATTSRDLAMGTIDADWEFAARPAADFGVRLVLLRLGLVLGADGGAFPVLREPFDAGSGIILGSGQQWMPWVHLDDATALIVRALEDQERHGVLHAVAPQSARHGEVAAALGVPCETTVPPEQVQNMLGGASELLLPSQRMVPQQALDDGFVFAHPEIAAAVKDLVSG
jgi:uncharacterized protein